ncbi:hypothetical protein VVR84_15145 [Kocuria carniphila]|uniref:Lipoprotein n=1 Tax=Kocuria carniphila TaxID=262208 RepID=A0ABV3V8J4_9MICC
MKKILRISAVGTALLASVALAGCSPSEQSEEETFEFTGSTLNVVHDNTYMPVNVESSGDSVQDTNEVSVEVRTQTAAQGAETPAWSISDNVLNLGSPCGGAVVGYCEASYFISVPEGTEVMVNGKPTAVN